MIGHVSAEDTKFLGGSGVCFPGKKIKFEILKLLEMRWNMLIQPITQYFVSF